MQLALGYAGERYSIFGFFMDSISSDYAGRGLVPTVIGPVMGNYMPVSAAHAQRVRGSSSDDAGSDAASGLMDIGCEFGFCADSAYAMSAAVAATMITTMF